MNLHRTITQESENGSLPKGWRFVRFDELAHMVNERVDPSATDAEIYVGLEHLDSESFKIRRWGTPSDVIGDKLQFRKGDIIFGRRRAYQRKLAVAEFDGICSAHAMVLRAKTETVDPEFLPFLMQSDLFMERAIDISVGSLSPTINWKTLRIQEFPLPPKDEQRRIAEILWAADEANESRIRVRTYVERSWQTLIDNIVPDASNLPESDRGRLEDICDMQNGRPFPSSFYSDVGFKLLRPGNLASNGRLSWAANATAFLDPKFAEENADWIVRPNDVVINLTAQSLEEGFMGRVCLAGVGDESLLNQRLGRFIPKTGVEPEYIFRVLQTSRFRRIVETRCEGSKVRHTYFRHFADLPIVLLSREDQLRVIEKGHRIDKAREAANHSVLATRQLAAQLRQHLLGGNGRVH